MHSQLVENHELGTNELYKEGNRDNVHKMGNTSGNAMPEKNGEERIIG